MGDFRAFACYCSDSLLERNDSAAIWGGSHTNNFPALRVHLVRLVFNELGTLNGVLGKTDYYCLVHFLFQPFLFDVGYIIKRHSLEKVKRLTVYG